jgi:hypothetical protein
MPASSQRKPRSKARNGGRAALFQLKHGQPVQTQKPNAAKAAS